MMTIKAKIHLAQDAREEARLQLVAATAHLDAGDPRAGDAHLVLTDDVVGRARLLTRLGRKRAAMRGGRAPTEDGPHDDPPCPDDHRDAGGTTALDDGSATGGGHMRGRGAPAWGGCGRTVSPGAACAGAGMHRRRATAGSRTRR